MSDLLKLDAQVSPDGDKEALHGKFGATRDKLIEREYSTVSPSMVFTLRRLTHTSPVRAAILHFLLTGVCGQSQQLGS